MSLIVAAAMLVQTFGGLTLDRAQSTAVIRSPDVAIASGRVAEEQALFDAARANYGPALLASYARAPQGGNNGETITQRLTTLGAQVTLGDLIAYSPLVAQAHASLAAARFDYANAQRSERIAVTGLYYGALTAEATLRARESALEGARSDLHAAHVRFRNGDVPRLDVVRASVALAQAQADLARAQADAENGVAALEMETGVDAGDLTLSPAPANATLPVPASPDDAVALAVARRPEIASARETIVAEERAVAVAQRGGLPIVTVNGGYTTGVDTGVNVAGPSLNVNATLPIGGAPAERVAAERARLAQAQAQLAKAQRQITIEVGAAVRNYRAQTAALAAAQRASTEAEAAMRATETGYRSGASSSLDIQTARATYVQAAVAEIAALYARAQAQATLELLIGSNHA